MVEHLCVWPALRDFCRVYTPLNIVSSRWRHRKTLHFLPKNVWVKCEAKEGCSGVFEDTREAKMKQMQARVSRWSWLRDWERVRERVRQRHRETHPNWLRELNSLFLTDIPLTLERKSTRGTSERESATHTHTHTRKNHKIGGEVSRTVVSFR